MKRIENHCVGCETCTLGYGCSQLNVVIFYCDECGDPDAKYRIDNRDYCEECAEKYLDSIFHCINSIREKAEILDVEFEENE